VGRKAWLRAPHWNPAAATLQLDDIKLISSSKLSAFKAASIANSLILPTFSMPIFGRDQPKVSWQRALCVGPQPAHGFVGSQPGKLARSCVAAARPSTSSGGRKCHNKHVAGGLAAEGRQPQQLHHAPEARRELQVCRCHLC